MTFKVYLKANDRIFVNGAVIKVDRKTTLEFLNDVSFLLQNQILQPEQADTPLKQLYYVTQIMLMAPHDVSAALSVYKSQFSDLVEAFSNPKIISELKNIDRLIHEASYHAAMKSIRDLFKEEAAVLIGEPKLMSVALKTAAGVMRETELIANQRSVKRI